MRFNDVSGFDRYFISDKCDLSELPSEPFYLADFDCFFSAARAAFYDDDDRRYVYGYYFPDNISYTDDMGYDWSDEDIYPVKCFLICEFFERR